MAAQHPLLKARYERIARDDQGEKRKYTSKTVRLDAVGTAEVAALLGVERPRIGRWVARGEMPMPAVWLAAGPVWYREDIEAMLESVKARRRQPSVK